MTDDAARVRALLAAPLTASPPGGVARSSDKPNGARAVPYSEIAPERVSWLWQGRVPRGMLTLLAGDPGLGKSMLTCELAAQVSRGGGAVLLASAEDSPAVTVRPRLEAAGADLALVHDLRLRREGIDEGVVLPDDMAALDQLVGKVEPALVVVDPLMAHLGGTVNSWHDQSVRSALAPLFRMAQRQGCAVVVVAHLNKGQGADPLHRVGGSIGISGAMRSALLLARDPEDPDSERGNRRVLAHFKSNISSLASSLAYEVRAASAGDTTTARLVLLGECDATGADLLARPDPDRPKIADAQDFLAEALGDGQWHPSRAIKAAAGKAEISVRTLERAVEQAGVEVESGGFPRATRWRLPSRAKPSGATVSPGPWRDCETPVATGDYEHPDSQSRHISEMAPLAPTSALSDDEERAERLAARYPEQAS